VTILAPESLPGFAGSALDPDSLNLLVGRHEPAALRRARVRAHLVAATLVLIIAAAVALGLSRRASILKTVAEESVAETQRVLQRGGFGGPEQLHLELLRARRLAEAGARVRPAPDAALALEGVLRAWPAAASAKPQTLAVNDSGAALSVSVEGDATPFLRAFVPPAGWSLDEPRLNATEAITRVSLQLRRGGAKGGVP
jgi:hypothetical protein